MCAKNILGAFYLLPLVFNCSNCSRFNIFLAQFIKLRNYSLHGVARLILWYILQLNFRVNSFMIRQRRSGGCSLHRPLQLMAMAPPTSHRRILHADCWVIVKQSRIAMLTISRHAVFIILSSISFFMFCCWHYAWGWRGTSPTSSPSPT